MNGWLQQLIGQSILNPLQKKGARLLTKAALFGLAAIAFLIAVVFLSAALFIWIVQLAGTIAALLIFAVICITIGSIALLFGLYSGQEKPQKAESKGVRQEDLAAEAQDHRAQDQRADTISEAVMPLIEILRSLGWKREEFALLAGAELAKTLPPLTLVGFAIVCGFLIGRMTQLPAEFLWRKKAA